MLSFRFLFSFQLTQAENPGGELSQAPAGGGLFVVKAAHDFAHKNLGANNTRITPITATPCQGDEFFIVRINFITEDNVAYGAKNLLQPGHEGFERIKASALTAEVFSDIFGEGVCAFAAIFAEAGKAVISQIAHHFGSQGIEFNILNTFPQGTAAVEHGIFVASGPKATAPVLALGAGALEPHGEIPLKSADELGNVAHVFFEPFHD